MKSTPVAQLWGPLLFIVAMCLLGSCAKKPIAPYSELTMDVVLGDPPDSLAVLPFNNQTETQDLEELVRSSFYSHLSVRPYRDVELYIVDGRLSEEYQRSKRTSSEIPPVQLGELLDCEAVIYGEVTEFEMIFAGIYSQVALGASVSIWDTRSGRQIWFDEHVVRFHEGGIPLSPIYVPLIALRSAWNLRPIVKIRAVDELARYLAGRVPAPDSLSDGPDDDSAYLFELQAGAFLDETRAVHLIESLRSEGYPAFMRSSRDGRKLWHRVLLGPYEDAEEALRIQTEIQEKVGERPVISQVRPNPNDS